MKEIEKTPPTEYWTVLPSSNDWVVDAVDPEGRYGAYVKGDGCVHVWEYENKKEDMSTPSPTRTWYGDGKEDFIDEDAIYRLIDIDDEILRLLALRETVIRHFEKHGSQISREEWYYGKPLGTVTQGEHIPIDLEITPARKPEEQAAIFAAFKEKDKAERIASYAKLGIEEKDIDQISMIIGSGDECTIHLRDGRTWTTSGKKQDE